MCENNDMITLLYSISISDSKIHINIYCCISMATKRKSKQIPQVLPSRKNYTSLLLFLLEKYTWSFVLFQCLLKSIPISIIKFIMLCSSLTWVTIAECVRLLYFGIFNDKKWSILTSLTIFALSCRGRKIRD